MQIFRIYAIKVMACLPGGQVLSQMLKLGAGALTCMPIELRSCQRFSVGFPCNDFRRLRSRYCINPK